MRLDWGWEEIIQNDLEQVVCGHSQWLSEELDFFLELLELVSSNSFKDSLDLGVARNSEVQQMAFRQESL